MVFCLFVVFLSLICVAVKAGWMFRQLVLKVRAVFLDSDLELVFFHGVHQGDRS